MSTRRSSTAGPCLRNNLHNMALVKRSTAKLAEALALEGEAIAIREKLASDNPSVTSFQRDLAASHDNIAGLKREAGRQAESIEAYERARVIREKLAASTRVSASSRWTMPGASAASATNCA